MMVDRFQRIAVRIDAICCAKVLPVRAKYLLALVNRNDLADQYNMILIGRRQLRRGFRAHLRYSGKGFGVTVKPGGEDDDQTVDNDTNDSRDHQTKDSCRYSYLRGGSRKFDRTYLQ